MCALSNLHLSPTRSDAWRHASPQVATNVPYRLHTTHSTPLTSLESNAVKEAYTIVRRDLESDRLTHHHGTTGCEELNKALLHNLCGRLQLPLLSATSKLLVCDAARLFARKHLPSEKGGGLGPEFRAGDEKQCFEERGSISPSVDDRRGKRRVLVDGIGGDAMVPCLPVETCLAVVAQLKTLHRLWLFAVHQRSRGGVASTQHGGGGTDDQGKGDGRASRQGRRLRRCIVADELLEALFALHETSTDVSTTKATGGSAADDEAFGAHTHELDKLIPMRCVVELLEAYDIRPNARSGNSTMYSSPKDDRSDESEEARVSIRSLLEMLLGGQDGWDNASQTDVLREGFSETPDTQFLATLEYTGVIEASRGSPILMRSESRGGAGGLKSQSSGEGLVLYGGSDSISLDALVEHNRPPLQNERANALDVDGLHDDADGSQEDSTACANIAHANMCSPPPLPPLGVAHAQRDVAARWFQLGDVDVPSRLDRKEDESELFGSATRRSHHTARRSTTGRLSFRGGSQTPADVVQCRPVLAGSQKPRAASVLLSSAPVPHRERSTSSSVAQRRQATGTPPQQLGIASHHALQQPEYVRYRNVYQRLRVRQFR